MPPQHDGEQHARPQNAQPGVGCPLWVELRTGGALIGALLVGLMVNYTGFLLPKAALFSNIALMVAILLWRPQGVYPVANR